MGVTASLATRYRLDDLRRLASGLASAMGVAPARASALASHLLWFDAAGASSHGIATLPAWLERIEGKEIDPGAEGRVAIERAGTAVFDARNGLAPLALERAAGIASEKARDVGVGIVRVRNLGPSGPAAPVAAGLAIGPFLAAIAGPGSSLALASPMPDGLPAVYDSELERSSGDGREVSSPPTGWLELCSPWIATFAGEDGWVILALSVAAMEPLTTFHERVASSFREPIDGRGQLGPDSWETRRREARDHGVSLDEASSAVLKGWAGRLGMPWPMTAGG